jgi:signal transduction histidine kinase
VAYCERQLAGAIGASSARIMVASVLREEMHDIDGVMQILDEASQLVVYSRRLETKSRELEAATDELRAANERLKELDKLKDDFVSTVSHELRTPLTSIRSFSEIVQDNPDLDVEQRNEFLRIVVSESERLTRLINDILDLAKMEAGQGDWVMVELAPGVIIEQAIAATSSLFARDNVALEVYIATDLPRVFADADRMTQVVVNLLANAVKFRNAVNGRVALKAYTEKGWLRVDISDNGPGIPEQDHERIFERFQQAGDTLTSKPTGTGLGLPISRQIVRHFGGEVWVSSRPGEDTRFSFNIPPAAASPARLQPSVAGERAIAAPS